MIAALLACVAAITASTPAIAATSTGSCWEPATEPITATVTWSEAPTTGTCRYRFDYLSAFEWVQLSTPDWNNVYVPVTSSTDPAAFEYAGRAWTLMSSASNGPVCGAAGACGGGVAVPDNCNGLTEADWSAYYDYVYFTGVYTGDPAKLEILMNCEV